MANQAEKVVFTSGRGQSVTLTNEFPYVLESVEGKGDVAADIQTIKSPYVDGSFYVDTVLESRDLTLNFAIIAENRDDLLNKRQEIASIFSPKTGQGVLEYSNGNVAREIEVAVDGVPSFPVGDGVGRWFQRVVVNLLAPDPYWKTNEMAEPPYKPLFKFPFSSAQRYKTGLQQDERTILNDGDEATPLYIELKGPATRPQIINRTTGKYIKVNQDLGIGETMVIDTNHRTAKVVFIDSENNVRNVVNWLDLGSSLTSFKLEVGENRIAYVAESDITNNTFNLKWQKRYNAV